MSPTNHKKLLSVAPMMAWTDRHCRVLHRLYARQALLFTEMVTTGALLHGGQWHLLDHSSQEHPLALQLGGNDPKALGRCAREAERRGYDEVNLNIGCPSERVQRGTFGACLMRQPQTVADCIAAMRDHCSIPVTIKCRLGVDDQDSDELLDAFVQTTAEAGCQRYYVHARKAILAGLSPAQNRSIPPLLPHRVQRLKTMHPHLQIIVNGGIASLADLQADLCWADGIMIGRAAYHHPAFLAQAEQHMYGGSGPPDNWLLLQQYRAYMQEQLHKGVGLHSMTRHLLSSCNGLPGARRFRQVLSNSRRLKENSIQLFDEALAQVYQEAA